ncbi:MAG TPA: GNAT family N-acetyltransferase [Jatrophihabitantaceae bacterium]|jgi:predicted acetyltransferase|nr:GNAT family N-acetyltransferase [Jatrophihabitantaceae bacterium]
MELVHPVPVEECEPWMAALVTTLLGSPWDDDFRRHVERWRRDWLADHTWGVQDRGRWVATLATDPRTLTVPGAPGTTVDISADALTAVTVAATHRRQGLLTKMITESLQEAVDRGDPVAVLIAAEWPIYGRFGYAPATRGADYTLFTRRVGASVRPDPAGTLRQVEPEELSKHAAAIFDNARRRWAGQVDRPGDWWSRRLGVDNYERMASGQGTWILHETDGEPDGFLAWKVTRDFELNGEYAEIRVLEFVSGSDTAYRNLWSYLAALDVIGEVKIHGRSVDEPVRWLLGDGRALKQEYCGDDTWVRLLDVPAALSARGYATPGRVVLDVIDDDLGGYAAGRFALDADATGAECAPTSDAPDLRLPQRALASIYLGDHSLRGLSVAGGIEELTAGAVARADAMFGTALRPWNATMF